MIYVILRNDELYDAIAYHPLRCPWLICDCSQLDDALYKAITHPPRQ